MTYGIRQDLRYTNRWKSNTAINIHLMVGCDSGFNRLRIGGCSKIQLGSTKAGNFLTSTVIIKFSSKTLHYGIGQ